MSMLRVGDLDMCVEVYGPEGEMETEEEQRDHHEPDGVMQNARRVLLISGTGGDLRSDPNRANHPLVRAGFMVAMFDQRGLGRTSKPDEPYSMEMYADDAARLLDELGWDTAHVIGISFGGMVAQHVALRHGERVQRLVLACTSAGGEGGSSFDLLAVHGLPAPERQKITMPIMDTRNDFSVDPPILAPSFDLILKGMAATALLGADDLRKEMGARRQLEARAAHNTWDALKKIRAHTFVVGGSFDAQAPPENVANLAGAIVDAQLQMFDGGHLFLVQDPSAWPAIAAFLQ
jgi:3-oxoadipate enol-lactonase